MNLRGVVASLVALIVAGIVVYKFLGTSLPQSASNPDQIIRQPESATPLPIVASGPQPKVSVSETEFRFGRMEVGEERSHDFVFTNEGEAPLTIKMGQTTCQCTYGDLKEGETRKILPGQSQKVTLTWKPEFQNDYFSKGADILTDDPTEKTVTLRIVGVVGTKIALYPEKEWVCPDIQDDKPAICSGAIASAILPAFKVTSVESRGMPLEFELVPLEGDDLRSRHALFGYHIRITVQPDMQMGVFTFPVTIKTDIPVAPENDPGKIVEFSLVITGVRRGPVRLAGPDWIDEKMAISLGGFDATAGKQVLIPMFVRNPPADGLQFTKPPETTPANLKVEIVRDEKAAGKTGRFILKVEYPAGGPRANFRTDTPGSIRIFTNHPHAPEIEYQVLFAAF